MSSINRRGVLAASAWSVPAIALTTAAPAFASSTPAPLACTPKGNRSQRHDGHGRLWDYHVDPKCSAAVVVTIADRPATYSRQGKRWTVRDLPANAARIQPVHVVAVDGATWSGAVRFS